MSEAPLPEHDQPEREYRLPANGWQARDYQRPFWRALETGTHRACCVWHRRCGKTQSILNLFAAKSQERVGTYRHVFPTLKQGRAVVWEEVDNKGVPMLAAFPDFDTPGKGRFTVNRRNDEMKLWFANGSSYQISGADEPDTALRGGNAFGWVFDEFGTSPKMRTVWNSVVQPIVRLNGGWVVFIYTPRGKNHGWKLYEMAKENPDWFCELLTRHDTSWEASLEELRAIGWPEDEIAKITAAEPKRRKSWRVPVVAQWMVTKDIADGMSEALARQEYECDFEGVLEASIYGDQLQRIEEEDRLGNFPYDENYPVETAWDFGIYDHTVIWFIQQVKGWYHWIDYLEGKGKDIGHWLSAVHQKPYHYIAHIAPHDVHHREKWSAESGMQVASRYGIIFRAAPKLSIAEGVSALRIILPRSRFHLETTEPGFEGLKRYRRQYDQAHDEYMDQAVHDSASHPADAARTYAIGKRVLHQWAAAGPLHARLPRG